MSYAVRLSDLQAMNAAERATALEQLSAEARGPLNGNAAVLDSRIRAYEARYEMTSAQLVERLGTGAQRETADIVEWLFWLKVRAKVDG